GDHAAVHRHARVSQCRRDQRRPCADRHRAGGDDERRELLRRRRWTGGGCLHDHRRRDDGDRIRPRPPAARSAGGDHRGRGARLPLLQLSARVELHGRLRRQPARVDDGRDHRRGGGQDRGGGVIRAAADPARRAVPGHDVRRAQAPEVPPADLPTRQRALPPSDGAHRLLQPADNRLSVRLDADARGPGAGAALRSLQRPQRPPAHGLDTGDDRPRRGRRRRERVPRIRAGDPQVPPAGRDAPAAAAPGRLSDRDRAGGRARPGNG
ncbi:MAG: hypothetical protein QOI18_192, partial [Solirubrobacteraceae bacterium]|nr:hypothetical protein [Solirubrobacteraceae bacterium]